MLFVFLCSGLLLLVMVLLAAYPFINAAVWREFYIQEGDVAKIYCGLKAYHVTIECVEDDEAYISYDGPFGPVARWISINKLWPT